MRDSHSSTRPHFRVHLIIVNYDIKYWMELEK